MKHTRYSTMTNEELVTMVRVEGGYGELAEELVERLVERMPSLSEASMTGRMPKPLQEYFAGAWRGNHPGKQG